MSGRASATSAAAAIDLLHRTCSVSEPTEHLSDLTLTAYLDDKLPPDERPRGEAHLAECTSCRHELIDAQRVVSEQRGASRRSSAVLTFAAAAAVLLFVVLPRVPWRGNPLPSAERGAAPPIRRALDLSVVRIVSPDENTIAADARPRFTWRATTGGSSYHVAVTDAAGAPVWSEATEETTLMLPANVVLRSGDRYFWNVDVLFADGRTGSSGMHRFTAR